MNVFVITYYNTEKAALVLFNGFVKIHSAMHSRMIKLYTTPLIIFKQQSRYYLYISQKKTTVKHF